jgi:hypothetical protein
LAARPAKVSASWRKSVTASLMMPEEDTSKKFDIGLNKSLAVKSSGDAEKVFTP